MGFKKGSCVLTNQGYKDISTLKIGDIVLNHNGESRKITNIIETIDRCVKVKTSNQQLETTKNQEIYIKDKRMNEPFFEKVSELKKGDKVTRVNTYPETEVPSEFVEKIIPTDSKDFYQLIGLLLDSHIIEEDYLYFLSGDDNNLLLESILNKYNIAFNKKIYESHIDYLIRSKELNLWCSKYLNVYDSYIEDRLGLWILGLDETIKQEIFVAFETKYKNQDVFIQYKANDYIHKADVLILNSFFSSLSFKTCIHRHKNDYEVIVTKEKDMTHKNFLLNEIESTKKASILFAKEKFYDLVVEGENMYIVDSVIVKGK